MDSYRQTPSPDRQKGLLFAFALIVGLITGCAGAPPSPTPPTASAADTPTPTATAASTPSPSPSPQFPLTLTDDEGGTVTLDAEPQTIVSLAPAFTEIIFGLGAGDRLAGGTDYDDYPPEAVDLPDVASYSGVVIEKVVDLDPDLILAGGNNLTSDADVVRLRELGFQVLVTYPPTVAAVLDDIRLIGRAVGAEAEAETVTAAMQERIDQVTTAVAGLDRPRVFYEIGYQPEIYGPAPNSFVADIVELAGGEAITTTDPAVFSIALEQLITADPEVIVLGDAAYGMCPSSVSDRPGWDVMTAVEGAAIRPVDDIVVTRPGPRLAEGLAALALAIHPDAQIAPSTAARELCAT